MLDQVLSFRSLDGEVVEVHDSVADEQALKVDVVFDGAFVVSEDPDRHVWHILARIALAGKLGKE